MTKTIALFAVMSRTSFSASSCTALALASYQGETIKDILNIAFHQIPDMLQCFLSENEKKYILKKRKKNSIEKKLAIMRKKMPMLVNRYHTGVTRMSLTVHLSS